MRERTNDRGGVVPNIILEMRARIANLFSENKIARVETHLYERAHRLKRERATYVCEEEHRAVCTNRIIRYLWPEVLDFMTFPI